MQVKAEKPAQPQQVPVTSQTSTDSTASDIQVLFIGGN